MVSLLLRLFCQVTGENKKNNFHCLTSPHSHGRKCAQKHNLNGKKYYK